MMESLFWKVLSYLSGIEAWSLGKGGSSLDEGSSLVNRRVESLLAGVGWGWGVVLYLSGIKAWSQGRI